MKLNVKSLATSLLLSALASSCAGPVKTRITGTGPGVRPPAALSFLASEEDSPKPDPATEAALRAALQQAGFSVTTDADYTVDYAVAERPSGYGVSAAPGGEWLSEEKAKRPFSSCKERTHRITLTVVERKTGTPLYRGSAEEHHCRATLPESKGALIAAILADLQAPQGKREVRRKGGN